MRGFNFDTFFLKSPVATKDGIYYYGSEHEGDQFTDENVAVWTTGGGFERRLDNRGKETEYRKGVYMDLCKQAAKLNLPIMDIACGPGMGLIPDILAFNSDIQALATDACPLVVEKWSEYLKENSIDFDVKFACFNAWDMPIYSDSVDVITSNLGFGSLRYAGKDQMKGLAEAYRVLKPGGYIFTVENEFEDMSVIQKVFDLWGQENWFKENDLTWHERFEQTGFIVEQEKMHMRIVEKDGWELAEVADSFGIEMAVIYKAYILRK